MLNQRTRRVSEAPRFLSHVPLFSWLSGTKAQIFPRPDAATTKRMQAMNYAQLRDLVLTCRNINATHSFLLTRGLPTDANMSEIVDPLIDLYAENAEWKDFHMMLTIL